MDTNEVFRGLLEAAPDAVVIIDVSGVIQIVNQQTENLFGYPRSELIGQSLEMLLPERLRGVHFQHRAHYIADPRTRSMGHNLDLVARRRDGSEVAVEISLSPLATENGLLITSSIRDISDRKRLEEQLQRKNEELGEQYRQVQEANRLKSEFLANMSHELRTPLNAIIGFAELLYDGKVGDVSADQQEFLGDILASSRHLLHLINDVLDLAKVEAGQIELRPEEVDVRSLIDTVRDTLRPLAGGKGIQIAADVDPQLGTVFIDTGKVKQILYNYLSNALKFTPEGGVVKIRAIVEDEAFFRLEVEDTGIGIAPEDLGRLFTEFQQLNAGTAKTHQGTGLGLALTKRVTEAHGGAIGVRSQPEEGSLFWARLPRVLVDARHGDATRPELDGGRV
ncbi:MAG TPA: ATP-binding protein [Herpetosiphonaceae bacterium]